MNKTIIKNTTNTFGGLNSMNNLTRYYLNIDFKLKETWFSEVELF